MYVQLLSEISLAGALALPLAPTRVVLRRQG